MRWKYRYCARMVKGVSSVSILIGVFMLGVGVECAQIRMTAWFVRHKGTRAALPVICAKPLLWIGFAAGALCFSPQALIAGIAGCATTTLVYAVRRLHAARREETDDD